MLNIMKTRARTVTQNRFLRRLMLHFDYLQDETGSMHQASTVIFLLANLYIQAVPTNTRSDSCLNGILGSSKWVPAILVLGLVTPLLVICLLATSLFFEDSLIDNRNNLQTPAHLKSHWYRIYKHLYRFNFLLLEPIVSGYMISLILTVSKDDDSDYGIGFTICAIIGGILGLILNLTYLFFVESILPNDSITSGTNRVNIALTTLALRMCLALDRYFTYIDSQAVRAVIMSIRLIPSVVAMQVNLFSTYFFNRSARLFFSGYQISNIIYSITVFIEGGSSYAITIIPASLFIVLALRWVYNVDLLEKSNLRNPSTSRLLDVISLSGYLFYKQNGLEDLASVPGLNFQAVMAHRTDNRFVQYEEFIEKFASAEERTEDDEKNAILFVTYMYERLWHETGEKNFKVLVYEMMWALTMRPNLLHLSILLARFNTLEMNPVQQSTYRSVVRKLETICKEIYLDKQSLLPIKEQFYAPKSVAEINESVAFKQKMNINDDDSKDGAENAKQTSSTGKSDLLHFDVYSSMQTIEQYERLVGKMQEVISTILKFYDKLKNRVVEIASAHETMKTVKQLKESVSKSFRDLDRLSGEQNLFHLLPYALFLETINNDRQASQKILKVFEHRSQVVQRNLIMARDRSSYTKFNLDLMLCIGVDCTKNSLGRMNYVSSNCEEVFGVQPKNFEGRNVNSLMSDDFQTIHDEFMDKFVKDQDKPYLGVSRERHVRIREQIYTKCDVLVKLAPVLNPTSLSFMCLLKRHTSDEEFIVLNHQGVIVGRSQGLDWAESCVKKSVETISSVLTTAVFRRIKRLIYRNNSVITRVFSQESEAVISKKFTVNHLTFASKDLTRTITSSNIEEDFNSKLQNEVDDDMDTVNTVRSKPIKFQYHGQRMFTDILIKFPAKNSMLLGLVDNRGEPPNSYTGNSNSVQRAINNELEKPRNTPYSKKAIMKKIIEPQEAKKKDRSEPYNMFGSADFVGNLIPSKKQHVLAKGQMAAKSGTQLSLNDDNNADQKVQPKHAKDNRPQNMAIDPFLEDDCRSSKKSSADTGARYTAKVKDRVLDTIKYQKKYMAWKELISIVVLQVLIWSVCGITNIYLNSSFNTKLGNLINLRTGFGPMLLATATAFDTGISLVEYMLVLRNRLPTDKFKVILPSINRSIGTTINNNIAKFEHWSLKVAEHIYSFEYEQAKRYLVEKYNYSYYYYGEDLDIAGKMTKEIDLIDYYREILFILDKWNAGLAAHGSDFKFNNRILSQYYEIMSKAWVAVSSNTVIKMLDRDTQSYHVVASAVKNLTIVVNVVCIVLAKIVVCLFWRLRKKTVGLYSILENILPYEGRLMQDRCVSVSQLLADNRMSETRLRPIVASKIRDYDPSYNQYWEKNKNARALVKTRATSFTWLGLGRLTIVLYFIIVAYQMLCLFTVIDLGDKLNRLLQLQGYQRLLQSTSNVLCAINFNAYFMATQAANFPSRNLPNFTTISATVDSYQAAVTGLISQLDNFVSQVPVDREETANFGEILTDQPCDYISVNYKSLPKIECEKLADLSFNRTARDVLRWYQYTIPNLVNSLQRINTTADPISILVTKEFLTVEFGRRNFIVDYASQFTAKFFEKIKDYHKRQFVAPLRTNLLISMAVALVLTSVVLYLASRKVQDNIESGLQIFLIVPPESYYHNPHIAAKLLTITR